MDLTEQYNDQLGRRRSCSIAPGSRRKRKIKPLLLFHRGHEHSGRWKDTVDLLGLEDVSVFAWDARGMVTHPANAAPANNFADVVKDVDAFVRHIPSGTASRWETLIVLGTVLAQ